MIPFGDFLLVYTNSISETFKPMDKENSFGKRKQLQVYMEKAE